MLCVISQVILTDLFAKRSCWPSIYERCPHHVCVCVYVSVCVDGTLPNVDFKTKGIGDCIRQRAGSTNTVVRDSGQIIQYRTWRAMANELKLSHELQWVTRGHRGHHVGDTMLKYSVWNSALRSKWSGIESEEEEKPVRWCPFWCLGNNKGVNGNV